MKLLMISGFVAVALLAAANTMLRSHAPAGDGATGSVALDVNNVPIEEFEDQSLVFSKPNRPPPTD